MPIPALPWRPLLRALLLNALLPGALLSGLSAPLAPPAMAATREERAQKFTLKAAAAMSAGDLSDAFKFANKALDLEPRNVQALYIRGILEFTVGGQVGGEQGAQLMAAGVRDLMQVSALAPDTEMGSIARDTVLSVTSPTPFPEPAYDCPPAAQASLSEAERWYSLRQPAQARAHYEAALQGCPQNANWWVFYGDVFFMAENYPGARQQYTKALERDPCNWMAHRFMADAWAKEGKAQESYESLLRALTCNPGYAAAQQNLRSLVESRRGTWLMGRAPVRSRQAALGGTWAALAEARKRAVAGGGTPLEQERAAVLGALAVWRAAPDGDITWKALSEAEARGELDSAIFLLLMDPALYADYIPWRDAHLDELVRFLGTNLATAPGLEIK